MQSLNTWIDKVIELWKSQQIHLSDPATIEEIEATEELLDFQFPADFKAFYLNLNGFMEWDWTKGMFSIWPLARIVEEYQSENNRNFIAFADYLINAHHIGFVKGKDGTFKNQGHTSEHIASTFSETIFLINLEADILY